MGDHPNSENVSATQRPQQHTMGCRCRQRPQRRRLQQRLVVMATIIILSLVGSSLPFLYVNGDNPRDVTASAAAAAASSSWTRIHLIQSSSSSWTERIRSNLFRRPSVVTRQRRQTLDNNRGVILDDNNVVMDGIVRGGGKKDNNNNSNSQEDANIQNTAAVAASEETTKPPSYDTTKIEVAAVAAAPPRVPVWTAILSQVRQSSIVSERTLLQLRQGSKLLQHLVSTFGPAVLTILALRSSIGRSEHGINAVTLYCWALLGASCGFHLFLYFITLGFALGVTVPLAVSLFVYWKQQQQSPLPLPKLTILHSAVTILWGLRLFSFLTVREYITWPALHQKVVEVQAKMNIPYASKVLCWWVYSFFYVALMASCWSRLLQSSVVVGADGTTTATASWGVLGYVGLLMQSTGLIVETVADMQKSNFKSRNHFTWCNVGLWRFSTHPNYLGEGLFWLGTYLAHGFHLLFPSALATAGLGFIMVVLKGSARSLASKQKEKYGQDPDFHDFQRTHNVFGPKRWRPHQTSLADSNNGGGGGVDEASNGGVEGAIIPDATTPAPNNG